MTDESVRCWLVERSYDDRNLVTLVYATSDGGQYFRRELSANMLSRVDVTAAREVTSEELQPVDDEQLRERYAREAERVASEYDPDEAL